jgi:hypothetical protein
VIGQQVEVAAVRCAPAVARARVEQRQRALDALGRLQR